ncbi:hypothetical protein Tco_1039352, partial [Tanacetum coccineum]
MLGFISVVDWSGICLIIDPTWRRVEEEDKEDVENVYDESANLIQNTKAGGSSSFTAAA